MSLVFSEPGNQKSELIEMRCCLCKLTKPMRMFPASCAVYRRGSCRSCNAMKARNKCANPLARKLESARVRYQRLGSVTLEDVAALYASYGVDITNEGDVKRTSICKIRRSDPFGVGNVTLKIRAPLTPPRGDETQPAHSPDGVAALQQPRDECA